jgi:hypothetical protein
LHRRLATIEAKFDQAAKAVESERATIVEGEISAEEAERTYRQLMNDVRNTLSERPPSKQTDHQAAAEYFRLVRGTTLSERDRTRN